MADYRAMTRRAAQKYGLDPSSSSARSTKSRASTRARARPPARWASRRSCPHGARVGRGPDEPGRRARRRREEHEAVRRPLRRLRERAARLQRRAGRDPALKSFAETNHYVSTILGGKTPKAPRPARRGSKGDTAYDVQTTTTPGVDNRVRARS
jgi:hypothetical protein